MKNNGKKANSFKTAGGDLIFMRHETDDPVVTGRQVAETLDGADPGQVIVMHRPDDGRIVEVPPDGTVDLREHKQAEFIVVVSDRSFRLEINGKREEWPLPFITVPTIAALANADLDDVDVVLELQDEADRVLDDDEQVPLTTEGVEKFRTQKVPRKILVSVYTTSGSFPKKGNKKVRPTVLVNTILDRAKDHLNLTDVTNWVSLVNGNEVQPGQSFADNGLSGTVVIHWGPREGGGGC